MAKLRFRIAMSLDGYSAGPHQSKKNPLGVGGERLHEWAFPLAVTFLTEGIDPVLEQARRAARGKDVSLAGGANAAQQYLKAGMVDEMEISVVPTLLGGGERLFDSVGELDGLRLVRTVAAPGGTHMKFVKA